MGSSKPFCEKIKRKKVPAKNRIKPTTTQKFELVYKNKLLGSLICSYKKKIERKRIMRQLTPVGLESKESDLKKIKSTIAKMMKQNIKNGITFLILTVEMMSRIYNKIKINSTTV